MLCIVKKMFCECMLEEFKLIFSYFRAIFSDAVLKYEGLNIGAWFPTITILWYIHITVYILINIFREKSDTLV